MKLVQGRTLGELIAALHAGGPGAPTLRVVVDKVLRLSQSMARTHAQGAAHLDVKPKNVLAGEFGDVQLIDWGAARVLPGSGGVDPGVVPGRREYTDAYHPRSGRASRCRPRIRAPTCTRWGRSWRRSSGARGGGGGPRRRPPGPGRRPS